MVCSICAGTGKLLTGEACVCGNGRADGEVVALRAHIAELEALNAAGSNQVAEMRKYIGELERERDEALNALDGIFVSHAAELTCRCWNADTCEPEPCECDECREARRVLERAKKGGA